MILPLLLTLAGQFSQIDTDGNGTPNIYRWRGAAEWQLTTTPGTAGQCLTSGGAGAAPAWGACGGGGISGTGTDNHITRWDGTTNVQDSGLVLDDSGYISRVAAAGTDQPGTDIRLSAGAGTGAGAPGLFWVSTPSILGSGTTVQTVMDRAIIGGQTTSTSLLLGNPDTDNIVTTPVDSFVYATSGSTGRGGDFTWQAGHHYGTAGRGGDLLLFAGGTGDLGIERGGNVDLTPGSTEGSGAVGSVRLFGVDGAGTATEMVVVNSDSLTISSGLITFDSTLAEFIVPTGLVMSLVGDYGTAGDVLTSNGAGSGMTWETPSVGAGGGASGSTVVDFGAWPADPVATVVITGQTTIASDSEVQAWIYPLDTADHTLDEHLLVDMKVHAHTIVAGTGFTITAVYKDNDNALPGSLAAGQGRGLQKGSQTYGQWSVSWRWQ